MSKKVTKKSPNMGLYLPTAIDADKAAITKAFEPVVETLKKQIPPLVEPQKFNQCVDIFTKWHGKYFYIMQLYKCPPNKGYSVENFEAGIARLEFMGDNGFNLAYFRHTGQWFTISQGISLEECKNSILNDPWFQVL